jgi:TM2 domain-containing membrane protein YozV
MISFSCQHCGRKFNVSDSLAGQKATCKSCKGSLIVPKLPVDTLVETIDDFADKIAADLMAMSEPIRTEPLVFDKVSIEPPVRSEPLAIEVECSFCREVIKPNAKKCKHCGEILDATLRPVANQPAVIHHHAAQFSPGALMGLSFVIPGLGQICKGQPINGIAWFIVVAVGYGLFCVPGLILHICCILAAGGQFPIE